jgi:hypothetical protein
VSKQIDYELDQYDEYRNVPNMLWNRDLSRGWSFRGVGGFLL